MALPAVIRAGAGARAGIHREVLYAWMENQGKEALISFVLSPSAAKQEEERREREPQTKARVTTMKEQFGFTRDVSDRRGGQPPGICVVTVGRNSEGGVEEQTRK